MHALYAAPRDGPSLSFLLDDRQNLPSSTPYQRTRARLLVRSKTAKLNIDRSPAPRWLRRILSCAQPSRDIPASGPSSNVESNPQDSRGSRLPCPAYKLRLSVFSWPHSIKRCPKSASDQTSPLSSPILTLYPRPRVVRRVRLLCILHQFPRLRFCRRCQRLRKWLLLLYPP